MDIFLLYLFTRVDKFLDAAFVVWLLMACVGAVAIMLSPILIDEFERDGKANAALRAAKKPLIWVFGICLCVSLLLPSKKDLAIIIGGHLGIEAAQSDTAKKVYAIVEGILDEELAKLAKKKTHQ